MQKCPYQVTKLHFFVGLALVKKGPGSWRDPAEDPARNLAGIPARFWPAGFSFPAGIPAGFSVGNEIPGGQNLTGNLGGKLNSRRPKSCRESRREAKFLAAKILPRISAGSEIPGGHNLAGNLTKSQREEKFPVAKILTRFMGRIPTRFMAGILARFMAGMIDSA